VQHCNCSLNQKQSPVARTADINSYSVVAHQRQLSPNSTSLVTSCLDMTQHVRRVKPMHFGCIELVEQHGSTCSFRRARHVERVESCRDMTWWAKWNLGFSSRKHFRVKLVLGDIYKAVEMIYFINFYRPLAEHLAGAHGILRFCRNPAENHCSNRATPLRWWNLSMN